MTYLFSKKKSPFFLQYVKRIISASNKLSILVPRGFAHGVLTLEEETEINYLVDNPYSSECDKGIRWDDPNLNINWELSGDVTISEKDSKHPYIAKIFLDYDWELT